MGTSPITIGVGKGAVPRLLLFTPAQGVAPPAQDQLPQARQAEFVICDQTIESCFRKLKTTGLELRPMFHWAPQRITAHVKLCVLALLIQRTAELRSGESWARLQGRLRTLKAVHHTSEGRRVVQTTRLAAELRTLLTKLGVPAPKPVLAVV
jgi:hypothetical protein